MHVDGWSDVLLGQAPVTGWQLTPSPQSQAEEQLRPNCSAGQLLLQLEKNRESCNYTTAAKRAACG